MSEKSQIQNYDHKQSNSDQTEEQKHRLINLHYSYNHSFSEGEVVMIKQLLPNFVLKDSNLSKLGPIE